MRGSGMSRVQIKPRRNSRASAAAKAEAASPGKKRRRDRLSKEAAAYLSFPELPGSERGRKVSKRDMEWSILPAARRLGQKPIAAFGRKRDSHEFPVRHEIPNASNTCLPKSNWCSKWQISC